MNIRYSLAMLLALCFSLAEVGTQQAHAQSYSLSLSKPLYPPLTGGTRLPMPWKDPKNRYAYLSLAGETFTFFGMPFPITQANRIGVSCDGNLTFQAGNNAIFLDAFVTHSGFDSLSHDAMVRWTFDGDPGNKILKIEYNHVNFSAQDSNVYASFQIWLWESTGEIDFHYLTNTVPSNEFYGKDMGPYVGLFMSDTTVSTFKHIAWLNGSAHSPSISTTTIAALTGTPSIGGNFALAPTTAGVDVARSSHASASLYPNPATTMLHILTKPNATVQIIDPLGRVERSASRATGIGESTLDVSALPLGCHYLVVTAGDKIERLKFLKN